MRSANILLAAIVSACADVDPNRIEPSVPLAGPDGRPTHYLPCGVPASESMVRCLDKAKAACPSGDAVVSRLDDPSGQKLVFECK